MKKDETALLSVDGPEAWRSWLAANHDRVRAIWLVFWKKGTGKQTLSYEHAVEEALCWGWIDSIIRRLDEERYVQKFTPRTNRAQWSPSNRARLRRLIAAGRMTEDGLARVDPDVLAALDDPAAAAPRSTPTLPAELEAELRAHEKAWQAFAALAPSHRRNYLGWIMSAKRDETRRRRLAEAIDLLERGKPLGPK